MNLSPYNSEDARPAPRNKRESAEDVQERRERPWFESATDEEYQDYYQQAWSVACSFIGNVYVAEEIADGVIDDLYRIQKPPSKAQIEGYIRVRAQWRAVDRLRSPQYYRWRHQVSLWKTAKDGDEYEEVPEQLVVDGAEATFFQELEVSERSKVTEQRLQRLHQAILNIKDGERRACFVLKHTYEMGIVSLSKGRERGE